MEGELMKKKNIPRKYLGKKKKKKNFFFFFSGFQFPKQPGPPPFPPFNLGRKKN